MISVEIRYYDLLLLQPAFIAFLTTIMANSTLDNNCCQDILILSGCVIRLDYRKIFCAFSMD